MAFPEAQRIPGPASLCAGGWVGGSVRVFVWDCGGDNQQWQEGRSRPSRGLPVGQFQLNALPGGTARLLFPRELHSINILLGSAEPRQRVSHLTTLTRGRKRGARAEEVWGDPQGKSDSSFSLFPPVYPPPSSTQPGRRESPREGGGVGGQRCSGRVLGHAAGSGSDPERRRRREGAEEDAEWRVSAPTQRPAPTQVGQPGPAGPRATFQPGSLEKQQLNDYLKGQKFT